MRDLLIRNGNLLLSADHENLLRADVLIRDGVIVQIAPELSADVETLDVAGDIVIPGLINAHVHSPGNFMRGTLEGLPLEVFMLYEVPPLASGREDPARVRLRTLIGAAEMLKLGITSVMDDAFFVPLTTPEAIDAIAGAYDDIGIRATLALDQPIVVEYDKYPFLKDILPPDLRRTMEDAPRETAEGMLAHYDHLIREWHGAGQGRIAAAVSCSAPQRATPDYLRALHGLSQTHDLPFFCHILETKLQRVLGIEKFGMSLIRYVDQLGILDERMLVIHSIWVDDEDIAILGASGASVAHNPVCNLRLGSGVMPFRKLRDAGVPICLGTDEAVSDDSHNLWGAIKTAGVVHAISGGDYARWPKAQEILAAVWDGGHRAMRRPQRLGRIETGAAADLAVLDARGAAFQPLHDIRRALVLAEAGASVRHTVVDGLVVVRDGRLTRIDEDLLRADLRRLEPQLRAEAVALRAGAEQLEPYYRQIVARAAATDVGFSRWVGQ
ncbi:MAG: amidohydrolase family protein [Cypionkella sp.]|nr:amidohydrolase family protein [Cypionkella sp.]